MSSSSTPKSSRSDRQEQEILYSEHHASVELHPPASEARSNKTHEDQEPDTPSFHDRGIPSQWDIPVSVALQYIRQTSLATSDSAHGIGRLLRDCLPCCPRRSKGLEELEALFNVRYDESDVHHVAMLGRALQLVTTRQLSQLSSHSSVRQFTKGCNLTVTLQEAVKQPGVLASLLFILYMKEQRQDDFDSLMTQIQNSTAGEVPLLLFLNYANKQLWACLHRHRVNISADDPVWGVFELNLRWLQAWADEYSRSDRSWDEYSWLKRFINGWVKAQG